MGIRIGQGWRSPNGAPPFFGNGSGVDDTPFTIFGAGGFVGSHILAHLQRQGRPYRPVYRDGAPPTGTHLGHVIYSIGLTADFRTRPFEAMHAHVGLLTEILQRYRYDSFLYISSARLYMYQPQATEETPISIRPEDPDYLYNGSKIAGECLCLALPNPAIRVARLASVYGADFQSQNFLTSIIMDAVRAGRVVLRSGMGSAKDYIHVQDAAAALVRIAAEGRQRLYNVGEGRNTSHAEICRALIAVTGCTIDVAPGSPDIVAPELRIDRLRNEFDIRPRPVVQALPDVVQCYEQEWLHDHNR